MSWPACLCFRGLLKTVMNLTNLASKLQADISSRPERLCMLKDVLEAGWNLALWNIVEIPILTSLQYWSYGLVWRYLFALVTLKGSPSGKLYAYSPVLLLAFIHGYPRPPHVRIRLEIFYVSRNAGCVLMGQNLSRTWTQGLLSLLPSPTCNSRALVATMLFIYGGPLPKNRTHCQLKKHRPASTTGFICSRILETQPPLRWWAPVKSDFLHILIIRPKKLARIYPYVSPFTQWCIRAFAHTYYTSQEIGKNISIRVSVYATHISEFQAFLFKLC